MSVVKTKGAANRRKPCILLEALKRKLCNGNGDGDELHRVMAENRATAEYKTGMKREQSADTAAQKLVDPAIKEA